MELEIKDTTDTTRSTLYLDIYLMEPEIKDTTDTTRSTLYLDIHLRSDSEDRLR
jgi:hypothetical protein